MTRTRGESDRGGFFTRSGELYDPLGVNVGAPPLTLTETVKP